MKYRPAVVVSVDPFQQTRAEVILAAVTSNVSRPRLLGDYLLLDWVQAGLDKPSRVTAILRTVRHALIVRQLGTFSAGDLQATEQALAGVLGLMATRSR